MMWFRLSIITLICRSGSDLFSKLGCREANDKYSHLKMVMAVDIVMGLHATFEIFVNGVEINLQIMLTYLPGYCHHGPAGYAKIPDTAVSGIFYVFISRRRLLKKSYTPS